ncbi:helix-turn-helix transcriptional regulator [Spirillospora sp. NPDC048911]|uniref:helix-turn-helix transcriptional regulator n=1 Tax=Spirillospora sp. NPDC048911 TaxID=3364527 RepID=UPI003713863E
MSRPLSCPTFVGRSEELAVLRAAWASGSGALVVVEGEAGIGKTRLVEAFAGAAAEQGARVLRGCCLPLSEDLPYAPMLEILHQLGENAAPAWPGRRDQFFRYVADTLASSATSGAAGELAGSVTGELAGGQASGKASVQASTLVVIEDLHWADTSTRDLLVFLSRALQHAAVLLVATVRSDELTAGGPLLAMLTELTRGRRAVRLRLRPFGRGEVAEQLTGILGARPPAALARSLYGRAEGNPFFVEELLAADPEGRTVPPTVSEIVLARLSGLSRAAGQVVRAAAVIGRAMGHDAVAAACGLPAGRLEAGLREAMTHGLLVATDEGYSFRHSLIHEAVYSAVLPGERTRLHGRIAVALSESVPQALDEAVTAAEIAHHWDAAGRAPEALAASMRAGRAAEALAAPAEAHAQYERALRLWPAVPEAAALAGTDRLALLAGTAEVASLAGRYERAGDLVAEALTLVDEASDPVRAAALLERLGRHRWLAGSPSAAWAAYEEAGRLVAHRPPSPEGAQVLAALSQSLMLRSRDGEAIPCARKAIEMAGAVGCAAAEGHASNTLGTCLCVLGRPQEGLPLLRRAVTIALTLDDAAEIERAFNNLTESLTEVGRHAEALSTTEEAIAHMRRCGIAPAYEPEFHGYAARALTRLGRWDDAEHAAQKALAGLEDAPSSALVKFVHPHVLLLETRRGRLTQAAALLDRLIEEDGGESFTAERAELALAQRRFAEASTAVREGLCVDASHSPALDLTLCALGARAEADAHHDAVINGRRSSREAALAEADRLVRRAEAIVTAIETAGPDLLGHLLLARAERSRLATEPDPAIWAEFATNRTAATDPFLTAYGRFRQAEAVLLRRGPRSKAAPPAREALRLARELGAAPLAADIEELARRAGIALTEPPKPPVSYDRCDFDLTRREREVVALLAQGLSNGQIAQALFISTKTASVHVSAILRKFGVTTRVQAAAVAKESGFAPP